MRRPCVLGFEANWFFREQFLSAQVYSVQVKSVYDVPSRFGAEENDDETSDLRTVRLDASTLDDSVSSPVK
jgi:hypothetical protein